MRSLLLAGGRSSRMGRDKALIEVGGEPCIARVAMALAEAGREPIRIAVAEPEDIERYGSVLDPTIQVE
ncbi:MAG: NTP transferase domain-containing protein, partial [Candidatus Thermoplasmatota archaeon]|nr:NTP transferase domain-containing protein [Candidatus Thermoplasmatota archaeon]